MAQPSSSHRERSDRERASRHHHHRSISSTTLLLVLSLILAVLAVMLSLPSQKSAVPVVPVASVATPSPEPSAINEGLWGFVTPKRSKDLAQRERDVAQREAEVARREAEVLIGAPGGVVQAPSCPACPPIPIYDAPPPPPIQTVIKEVVKEADLTPPGWWDSARARADETFERELKIAEREREISRREESVNRREHDASRRETWIMEQLGALGDGQTVEEEYIYEQPAPKRRPAAKFEELPLPPVVVTEVETEYATRTITQTQHHTITPSTAVVSGQPANTRRAAVPTPVQVSNTAKSYVPRTTQVEVFVEEEIVQPQVVEEEYEEEIPRRRRAPNPNARQPQRWWGQ